MGNDHNDFGTAVKATGLSIHLTLAQVIGFIKVIVDRDPDKVAKGPNGGSGCMYMVRKGHVLTPVCIVGQMFADMGLLRLLLTDPSNLTDENDQFGSCSLNSDMWNGLAKFGVTADKDAQEWLYNVQRKQDSGSSWSDAFNEARDEYLDEQNYTLDNKQAALDAERQALTDLFG